MSRRCRVALIVLGCLQSGSAGGEAVAWPPALRVSAQPQVTSTDDGFVLEWRAPEAQLAPRADGAIGVALPGYWQTSRPGELQLPFASELIALPPDAIPTLQVLLAEETDQPLPGPLALAPIPEGVRRDAAGRPIGGAFVSAPGQANTGSTEAYSAPIAFESVGIVRGVRLARVIFYPVRPVGDHLRVTTHLRASVTFNTSSANGPSQRASDPLLAAVRSAVVNPDHVQPLPSSATRNQRSERQGPGATLAAIEVNTPGLIAITYEALAAMGFSFAGTDPRTLYLTRGASLVALEWEGDDDASFEPGERLLFYADPRPSRWTPNDVYFLHRGDAPGLRMSARSADLTSQPDGIAWTEATAEVNALYTPDCFCKPIPPGRNGDRWVWDDLKRPGHPDKTFSLQLPYAVDATQPATLTAWFIGYTSLSANPDHRVDVALNGVSLSHVEWDGKTAITTTLSIPAGALHGGNNTLALSLSSLPGAPVDGLWLDAFAVRYARSREPAGASVSWGAAPINSTIPSSTLPYRLYLPLVMRDFPSKGLAYSVALASPGPYRAYDVTDPLRPQRLTDVWVDGNMVALGGSDARRYLVTAAEGILNPARIRPPQDPFGFHVMGPFTGADYFIITHPAFVDALGPLVSLRQSQGLTTTVVNVLGIYDVWGDGRPDPTAIRAFIANAYATWNPRPTYVLLVGDGSFDPKLYRADSPTTFIPPYLADVDPWTSETAADNRYVTVDGDDALPDMLIGRLPVKTLAEAQTVVSKLVQYETQPLPGGWNADVVLVADDPEPGLDFVGESEVIAAHYIPSPFAPRRIYFTPPISTVVATRQAVLNQWSAGALMIQFTGHSSWQQWAVERLLHLDDLATLRNGRRWPIVVEMTCFTSAFQRPEPTLDENLLTSSGGGVVAAWGATGLGVGTGHHALAEGFYQAVFHTQVNTLGEAALAGKLALAATHQDLDLLDTFTLLGDPATRPNRTIVAWASQVYLPLIYRGH